MENPQYKANQERIDAIIIEKAEFDAKKKTLQHKGNPAEMSNEDLKELNIASGKSATLANEIRNLEMSQAEITRQWNAKDSGINHNLALGAYLKEMHSNPDTDNSKAKIQEIYKDEVVPAGFSIPGYYNDATAARWDGPHNSEAMKANGFTTDAKFEEQPVGGSQYALTRDGSGANNASAAGTLPVGAMSRVYNTLKGGGRIRQYIQTLETQTGVDLKMPAQDSTALTWSNKPGSASGQADGDNVPFAEVTMRGTVAGSDPLPVRNDVVQDSAVDIDAHMSRVITRAGVRWMINQIVTGSGTGGTNASRQGLLTGGTDVDTAGAAAITFEDILKWFIAIDIGYLGEDPSETNDGTRAAAACSDLGFQALVSLAETNKRPFFMGGIGQGMSPTLFGLPLVRTPDMSSATSLVSDGQHLMGGDFGSYMQRLAGGVTTAIWRTAKYGVDYRVAYQMFARFDCRYIGGFTGTTTTTSGAVQVLTQA